MSAEFHSDFPAINNNGLGLQIRLPDFFGMALRKADIAAELFAFTGKITLLHRAILYLFCLYKSTLVLHLNNEPYPSKKAQRANRISEAKS